MIRVNTVVMAPTLRGRCDRGPYSRPVTDRPRRRRDGAAGEVDSLLHDPQPVHAAAPAVPAALPLPAVRARQPGRRRRGCSAGSAPPTGSTATSPAGSARSASSARSSTRPSTGCCSSSPSSRSSSTTRRRSGSASPCSPASCSSAARSPSPRCSSGWPASTSRCWGKLATFLLMFAIPGFMLGSSDFPGTPASSGGVAGSLGIPGLVLSLGHGHRLRPADPRRHRRRPGRAAAAG